jgi:omega-amidase
LGGERSSWIVREIPNTLLSATQLTLRVAIAQMQMHWTIEENVAEILRAISIAKREGAQLCVFPEMALTGFHRQIASIAKPALIEPAMRAVQDACAANHIAAILGAPTFGANNAIYNSAVFVDERGEQIAAVAKIGLTVPEATFFTHGTERRIVSMLGLSMSAVLCIEIHDRESIMKQLAASDAKTNRKIDLLAWPGIMRPDPNAANANEEKHIEDARQLARETGAWIVQANWPNSLNYPAESAFAGQSVVIDPSGEFAVRLPIAQAGVGVFSLGSTQFSWHVS